MATLRLEIVTPEAKTYSEDVDFVLIPGAEGELGVLPGHVPLLTELVPGELQVKRAGQDEYLAVGSGFVEITQTHVSVLTDMAVREADIDEEATQAAIDRARAAMTDERSHGEENAMVQAALQKSLAQLKVKRRRRG
jgi:F-type H+-transporting ATPase subunit epsilon